MERILLLVDDEENIVASLLRLLRQDGYKILTANSGKDGLTLLAQNEVGVIISDQRMPGMSGVEFLGQVKQLYPDTVRIVLSGYTELNSVTDAINRGAVYKFLTKPWEDELLRANVDEAFHRYEMKIENLRLQSELKETNDELQFINQGLKQQVRHKTHEALRDLGILQVSQEILEYLPVAVLGIGEDGMIVIANQMAHQLFGAEGAQPLLGELVSEAVPAELLGTMPAGEALATAELKLYFAEGREFICTWHVMGERSRAKGVILTCMPQGRASVA